MVYTILISIVFIAEIIITIAIISALFKFDEKILAINEIFEESKKSIYDICFLGRKISEQISILADDFVKKFYEEQENRIYRKIVKILSVLLLWKINSKTINRVRKSKLVKAFGKGLSFLENMV